ncbi:MAG TPA: helix-turn-helix transcriptional regulator [Marinagarivorans sp.]
MQKGQSDMQGGHVGSPRGGDGARAPRASVSTSNLYQMAARAGRHYQLVGHENNASHNAPHETVLSGQVVMQDASDALRVHTTDAVSKKNWTAEIDLPAGLIFCFVQQGRLSFKLDAKHYSFSGESGPNEAAIDASVFNSPHISDDGLNTEQPKPLAGDNCFLLYLQKPARLTRFIRAGEYVKKLNVTADSTWLTTHGFSSSRQHLPLPHGELVAWPANAVLRQVALQLLTSSQQADSRRSVQGDPLLSDNSPLGSLLLQGLATHCLALAINQAVNLCSAFEHGKKTANNVQQRLLAIVERYIHSSSAASQAMHSNAAQPTERLNTQNIAHELGMSVSAVQRLAKQTLGDSVVNYIRAKKLDIARKALEQGTMTIGEVAYHAGYKHSSNFAIAFKKAFGVAPGSLQEP